MRLSLKSNSRATASRLSGRGKYATSEQMVMAVLNTDDVIHDLGVDLRSHHNDGNLVRVELCRAELEPDLWQTGAGRSAGAIQRDADIIATMWRRREKHGRSCTSPVYVFDGAARRHAANVVVLARISVFTSCPRTASKALRQLAVRNGSRARYAVTFAGFGHPRSRSARTAGNPGSASSVRQCDAQRPTAVGCQRQ